MTKQGNRPDADSATDLLEPTDGDAVGEDREEPQVADTESGESSETEEKPAQSAARYGLGVRLVAAGGALLLAATTAGAVYFYLQFDEQRDIDDARAAAAAAACDYARDLANFDFNNLDPYFSTVLDGATGEWKSQFDAQRDRLREVYTSGAVVSQVTEARCATMSGDRDSAEALVVITESIANLATESQPQLAQIAMTFTLDNVDGRWLVGKLSAPQLP